MSELDQRLEEFAAKYKIRGKGPLSVMLVITRNASAASPPYSPADFLTSQGGQVAGLGRSAVQAVLADHGITRVLAEEGGRTSRGSMSRMQSYISFLNDLSKDGLLDFPAIEALWVKHVEAFFAAKPFRLKVDAAKSLRSTVADLIGAAFARQRACPGTMVAGAVLQHLVGAKLELALPDVEIGHNGFSVADEPGDRKGDFVVGDSAIHVTTAPSQGLIEKCRANLAENFHPVIVTTEKGTGGAVALATDANIADRVDVLEIEQFVATNVLERSGFARAERPVTVRRLVDSYNRIVDQCETDPSLKIKVGTTSGE